MEDGRWRMEDGGWRMEDSGDEESQRQSGEEWRSGVLGGEG